MQGSKTRAVMLFLLAMTFGVLIFGGYIINKEKPPIPSEIRTSDGQVVFTGNDIVNGQNFYFSRGGQHIGTIWGHGSYLAPDWSADFLHRMGLYLAARHHGLAPEKAAFFAQEDFDALDSLTQARLKALVTQEIKTNRYDSATGTLIFTPWQTEAFNALKDYYTELFIRGNERMGIQSEIVKNADEGHILTGFFAWLSWAAGTLRPDKDYTYTTNWPYDPLVGNTPLPETVTWSIVSVILLIFCIAAALFFYLRYIGKDEYATALITDFPEPEPTPSQKAVLIYFLTALLLFILQIGMGGVTAHFTVEGTHFYGIPLGKIFPYAAARTWHIQLAIFFIATCFLAAGLFIGPMVGKEPKGQKAWVIILFAALVAVVVGTLGGTWMSALGKMGNDTFYMGHQGYEFIELGRIWQLLLIAGMLIWLVLMYRAISPALKDEKDSGGLTHLLLYSSIAGSGSAHTDKKITA
ncbi:MAG: hypothetical protein AB7S75_08170 [Desulfococcaceae bacterium]